MGRAVQVDGDKRFDLGLWQDDDRTRAYTRTAEFHHEGRTRVSVPIKGAEQRDRTHAAVSIPMAWVLERIRVPGGRRAIDAGLSVRAWSDSWLLGAAGERATPSAERLASVPFHVRVAGKGYEKLEFSFRLEDGLDWTRTVEPTTTAEDRKP